jgi:PAS domain S-box-containing protein
MATPRRIIEDNILHSIPVGLVVIDRNGRLAAVSPAAGEMLGIPADSLKGRPWRDMIPDDPANGEFGVFLAQAAEEGRNVSQRLTAYRAPDGRSVSLILSLSCLHQKGRKVGVVCIFEDVTELHRAKERETRILLEKNRLQHDIIDSLGNLALSVAHQIRNPTTAIGGFSRKLRAVMRERGLSTEYPDIIFAEALRLEGIVGTVVRLASIKRPTPVSSPLAPLVERVAAETGRMADKIGRKAVWDLHVEGGDCFMDRGLIHQALAEILRNAVEFSGPKGAEVRVSARLEEDAWRIAVADDGPGIAPHDLPFVFDPFFTTKARGAGIGLTMARKIVMEHGGEMSAHSAAGGGTTVSLRLPLPLGAQARGEAEQPPERGMLFGEGLDACLLTAKAREAGVNIVGLSAVDAVREIQMAEGYESCFGRGRFDICGQDACYFRADCLKLRRVEAPCRITYAGRPSLTEQELEAECVLQSMAGDSR